jgi:hypothetical protein
VAVTDRDAGDLESCVSVNAVIRMRRWGALTEWIVFEHEGVFVGDVEGNVEFGLEFGVAPDVIEMAMGVENGDRVCGVLKYPFGGMLTGVDDEGFALNGDKVAVGLICPHGLSFNLHESIMLL